MQISVMPRAVSAIQPATSTELETLTLAEASELIRHGAVTSVQLVARMLDRISACDPQLNSYITVTGEAALAEARGLDAELAAGSWRGPLHGVPIAIKDNIEIAGVPSTAASKVYRDRIPNQSAEVVRRLKEAGAVVLGKLNLHEFAAGGTGHVSAFGPTRNPWATDRVPGGSSSGSGAAVAARLCYAALGTDTGGSVRIPSSWCGIVGLKPTYGLVSIRGIVPLIYSLDHCGPMTRSVEDAAILLNAMVGYDPDDAASVHREPEDYVEAMEQPTSGFGLGLPPEFYVDLDPEVEAALGVAIEELSLLTAGVVSRASLPQCVDLMKFLPEMVCYHGEHLAADPGLYQPETRAFLAAAPPLSAVDYLRARENLTQLRRTIDAAFDAFDFVVLPTERIFPYTVDESIAQSASAAETGGISPEQWVIAANTYPFNLYGIPAITVPCGCSTSGLPIGMTIAGPRFSEGRLLALAAAYQRTTDWHRRFPPI